MSEETKTLYIYRTTCGLAFAALVAFFTPDSRAALGDYENSPATGSQSGFQSTAGQWLAQKFTAGSSYDLEKVVLYLSATGSPDGDITCRIYSHDAVNDSPDIQLGTASSSLAANTVGTNEQLVEFTGLDVSLTSGAIYWIAVDKTTVSSANYLNWYSVDGAQSGNSIMRDDDGSGVWTSDSASKTAKYELYSAATARVASDLQVLYDFKGTGSTVLDVSGVGSSLDLTIATPANVSRGNGFLTVDTAAVISSSGAATKVIDSVVASSEITIEAWVQPANVTQYGPARIVTLSSDSSLRNITLGQGYHSSNDGSVASVRLRTGVTGLNGVGQQIGSPAGSLSAALAHLVFTRDSLENAKLYIDGVESVSDSITGAISNWDTTMPLALANEPDGSRMWLGTLRLVAVYSRALSSSEVQQNFQAGPINPGVVDSEPPVISLLGANPQSIECGQSYVELGATATDLVDGDLSSSIVIDSSGVNTSSPGTYQVTYNVADSSGNNAVESIRLVTVSDTQPPSISLIGEDPQNVTQGETYLESGATAQDACDGDLSGSIVIDASGVDTSVVGTYQVTYNVSDGAGNAASEVTRAVVVSAQNVPPVASAGADTTITDSDDNGAEFVTLDGSGSTDSDGTISSYVWKEGGTEIATGATPSVSLTIGVHTIELTITDDDGATDADTVVVTVNAAPAAEGSTNEQLFTNTVTGVTGADGSRIDLSDADLVIENRESASIRLSTAGSERLVVDANGTVTVNAAGASANALDVDGTIRAKKVMVDADWADFVFEEGYELKTLEEIETYIETHGRLPDVPSAEVVQREGVSIGDSQSLLLRKIEELTLYLLQQSERVESQAARIDTQEELIRQLRERIQQLESGNHDATNQ